MLRSKIKKGIDPISSNKDIVNISFSELSARYIENKKSEWTSKKHEKQWYSTLEKYSFPFMGDKNVRDIETLDVTNCLNPIWKEKPETASRVRQRIESILSYAKTLHFRDSDNPASWKNNLENILPQTNKLKKVIHHLALDYREISNFIENLRKKSGNAAKALEFTILTATRSKEVRGVLWSEINFNEKIWIIPSERMKSRKEHRISLTDKAIECLGEVKEDGLIFSSSTKIGKILSDMSLLAVLRRMQYNNITVHGFRSTFRDWAGELTIFFREVIEHALAHQLKDKAEAAYARGTLLGKRRKLMEA